MDKESLGVKILQRLGYIDDGIIKFAMGEVMYSNEPYGILYDLSDEMQNTVAALASEGYQVYAVLSGKYLLEGGTLMKAVTYLCIAEEDIEQAEANEKAGGDILEGIVEFLDDHYGYRVLACVDGFAKEFGYVCVRACNGGLTRTS